MVILIFHDEDWEKKNFCKLACFSVLTRKKRRLQLTYDRFQPTYDFYDNKKIDVIFKMYSKGHKEIIKKRTQVLKPSLTYSQAQHHDTENALSINSTNAVIYWHFMILKLLHTQVYFFLYHYWHIISHSHSLWEFSKLW